MRILAVRGENLASLRRFEVDLCADPLASAGLFAITGPTGSGKSTLLDAMCLALYARSGVRVGPRDHPANLSGTDGRGVLRRGAGEGFAEVDFEGREGGRYRARWSVRRARGKPDGRFQKQQLELFDLDGDRVLGSDRKTDTLEQIEAAVGLSFDQFRRSVLLAQGEFDAFLHAPVKQRGELLERMTGTGVYRELSIAAHRRAAGAEEERDRLRGRVSDHAVLGPEARAGLEEELRVSEAWLSAARARREGLAEAARWYARRTGLAAHAEAARGRLEAADAAWEAAGPARAEVTEARHVEPLRPLVARHDDAARELGGARTGHAHRVEQARAAEARRALAAGDAEAAVATLEAARAGLEAARPELQRARDLDAWIETLEATEAEARRVSKRAAEAAGEARMEAERVAARLVADRRALAEATGWLEAHAELEGLAAQWPRWENELRRISEADVRLRALVERAAREEEARRVAEVDLGLAGERRAAAAEACEAAQEALAAARSGAETNPSESARAEIARLVELHGMLGGLAARIREARSAATEIARADETRAAARKERNKQRRRIRVLSERIERDEVALAEAEAALERLRTLVGLDAVRRALVAGEPCPVCGSKDHPGAGEAAERVTDAQAERVSALRESVRTAMTDRAAAQSAEEHARGREEDAVALARGREAVLAALRTDWELQRLALGDAGVPDDLLDPGAEAAVRAGQEAVAGQRATAEAQLQEARRADRAVEEAREALEARRKALDEADRAYDEAVTAERDRVAQPARTNAERAAVEAARAEALELLRVALEATPGWWSEAREDPAAFMEARGAEVERLSRQRQRQAAAAAALDEAAPRVERLRERRSGGPRRIASRPTSARWPRASRRPGRSARTCSEGSGPRPSRRSSSCSSASPRGRPGRPRSDAPRQSARRPQKPPGSWKPAPPSPAPRPPWQRPSGSAGRRSRRVE